MKKLLIGLAVIVVLVLAALVAVPYFIPVDTYKQQIAKAAREATGRDLAINGDFRLSLLPRFELEAGDVVFANAPGASQAEMAKLAQLLVRLEVLPLLTGEIAVDSFVLVEPVIHLEIDRQGRANWQFAQGPQVEPDAGETPVAAPDQEQGSGGPGLGGLSLGDVRLERGLITYHDAGSGQTQELSDINMKVSLPDLASPFGAEGSLVWNGEKLTLTIAGDSPNRLLGGETTPLKVALRSTPVSLAYDGEVTLAEVLRVVGELDLEVPSIRQLAAWTGNPIGVEGSGLGPLKIKGRVDVKDRSFAFKEAEIGLDKMTATGDFAADTGGAKPYLKGRLDIDLLDLNPYLPPPAEAAPAEQKTAQAEQHDAGPPPDWSDEPIDLSGLKAANLDFDLSVGGIRVQDLKIDRSAVKVSLKDGLLVTDLSELNLYDGKGKGKLTLDGRGKVPAVAESFNITGVAAEPLLTDASGFDRLAGTGNFDISVETRGASQRAMVKALNGRGAVTFTDGAIKGVNLAAMVRNVKSAFGAAAANEEQKTDFAELSGTFKIHNGTLRNDDMKMLNPLLRLAGAGKVDLPKRTVNYRVEPKVVGSLEGQGAKDEATGLAVPVIIEGPWHDLKYRPDLANLVGDVAKDPKKALKDIKETLKGAKGGLSDLLRGAAEEPAGEAGQEGGAKTLDPGKVLKKLFGD